MRKALGVVAAAALLAMVALATRPRHDEPTETTVSATPAEPPAPALALTSPTTVVDAATRSPHALPDAADAGRTRRAARPLDARAFERELRIELRKGDYWTGREGELPPSVAPAR